MKSKTSFTQMLMILLTLDACDTAGIVKPAAEPANGRSLEEVTTQRQSDYAFPNTQSQAITLGSDPASMLDNLPDQDTNRRLIAIHEYRLIDIMTARTGADYGQRERKDT
jgi:hypothetical protein